MHVCSCHFGLLRLQMNTPDATLTAIQSVHDEIRPALIAWVDYATYNRSDLSEIL